MIDPKKDYDLLMRYLQNGAGKHKAALPERAHQEDWNGRSAHPTITAPLPKPPSASRKLNTVQNRRRQKKVWTGFRILLATAAIFVLVFASVKIYTIASLNPDSLYNKMAIPYVADFTSDQVPKNGIEYYYRAGNYVGATLKARKQKSLSDRELFLTGMAYMQRDDYTAAIKRLEPAAANFKSAYRAAAEFYLSLAYLKNEDYDHCIQRIEQILYTPAHPYHDRVSPRLVDDIKMLKWK